MKRHPIQQVLLIFALAALVAAPAVVRAGGPLFVDPGTSTPYTWAGGFAGYNIEIGPWHPLVTNPVAVPLIDGSMAAWVGVPTATLTGAGGPALVDPGLVAFGPGPCPGAAVPIDVDETNVFCVLPGAPDGQSPVVFDDDGVLFAFLGFPPGVLGFASPEWAIGLSIVEGYVFLNGSSIGSGALDITDVTTHEFGHFINLAHSVTNGQVLGFADFSGPEPVDTFGFPAPGASAETMFPFIGVGPSGAVSTPHPDDAAILSRIYGGLYGATISGTVLASDGVTGLTGVNVIARNFADPFFDAASAISGDFTQGGGGLGLFDGSYLITGLTPGASYGVFIDGVLAGGFSTPLRSDDPFGAAGPIIGPFPGDEDGWNAAESANPLVDDPTIVEPIVVALGMNPGIDIIVNSLPPDPYEPNDTPGTATAIGCGAATVDAKIDPLGDLDWYVLTGTAGDTVEFDIDAGILGSPLDSQILALDSALVPLAFSDDDTAPGEGGSLDSYVSLTIPGDGIVVLAVSSFNDDEFDGGPNAFTTGDYDLITTCSAPIVDAFEPNDSPATATPVGCGFSSTSVTIDPAGDVDWFEITGTPGEAMAIDIDAGLVGSTLDSQIQAHDSGLVPLAFSDDTAAPGEGFSFDSFVSVIIPPDGIVMLAVSSFNDDEFDGGPNAFTTGFYEIYTSCAPPADPNEPNDGFADATPISCPSAMQTVEIFPTGDLDFYLLSGTAGYIVDIDIDARISGSTLDSVLGTFDSGFTPDGLSDDDTAPGEPFTFDSYLSTTMPGDGLLYIAVAAFPDFDFTGDGFSDGPYTMIVTCSEPCIDADGDGYGENGSPLCPLDGFDCDDTDPAIHPAFGATELIKNGDFEGGSLTDWTVDAAGSGSWFVAPTGGPTPFSGFPMAVNPTGGASFATSDSGGPGTHALSQTLVVPSGSAKLDLAFDMVVNDWSGLGGIVDPIGLDHTGPANQHARVDIMDAAATPFSTAGADIVASYYIGVDPSDPNVMLNPWTSYAFDIHGDVPPGTYRLRFADTNNVFFQHQAIDNVSIVAQVRAVERCANGIDDDCDGLIDAADPRCDPLLVVLESFAATLTADGVELTWTTASEVDNAGFHVLRQRAGARDKSMTVVTPAPILAAGSTFEGATYRFVDRSEQEPGAVLYYLQSIDNYGRTELHGPVQVQITPAVRERTRPAERVRLAR